MMGIKRAQVYKISGLQVSESEHVSSDDVKKLLEKEQAVKQEPAA